MPEATWKFLKKYYILRGDTQRGTNNGPDISVRRRGFGRRYPIPQVKRLCAALIHFGPVLNSVVDSASLRSNRRENPPLSAPRMSRAENITAI
jgi:hypothetical protein